MSLRLQASTISCTLSSSSWALLSVASGCDRGGLDGSLLLFSSATTSLPYARCSSSASISCPDLQVGAGRQQCSSFPSSDAWSAGASRQGRTTRVWTTLPAGLCDEVIIRIPEMQGFRVRFPAGVRNLGGLLKPPGCTDARVDASSRDGNPPAGSDRVAPGTTSALIQWDVERSSSHASQTMQTGVGCWLSGTPWLYAMRVRLLGGSSELRAI